MEIDVSVFYEKSCAERADQVYFGSSGFPDVDDAGISDDPSGFLCVAGGDGSDLLGGHWGNFRGGCLWREHGVPGEILLTGLISCGSAAAPRAIRESAARKIPARRNGGR